jgi:hypothetical protein
MEYRIRSGGVPFISPSNAKLKLSVTLTGAFAEQFEQWAVAEAEKWRASPNYPRELNGERRRLAFMLLCEAIGAVADGGGFRIKDGAVDAVIAPRLAVEAGTPRRVEQLELVFCARGYGLDFIRRHQN